MKISDSKHRLIELLRDTNDTQNEMARKTGLTKSAISNYINGTREPRQDAIYKISDAYDVSPSWLMGLDTPKVDVDSIGHKLIALKSNLSSMLDDDRNEKYYEVKRRIDYYEKIMAENLVEYCNYGNDNYGETRRTANETPLSPEARDFIETYQNAPEEVKQAIQALLKYSK